MTETDYRSALAAAIEEYERLRAIGFDLSTYSNDMAAVHTVLKRLNQAGELRFIPSSVGKPSYSWRIPPRSYAIGPEIAEFIRDGGHLHTIRASGREPRPRQRKQR